MGVGSLLCDYILYLFDLKSVGDFYDCFPLVGSYLACVRLIGIGLPSTIFNVSIHLQVVEYLLHFFLYPSIYFMVNVLSCPFLRCILTTRCHRVHP